MEGNTEFNFVEHNSKPNQFRNWYYQENPIPEQNLPQLWCANQQGRPMAKIIIIKFVAVLVVYGGNVVNVTNVQIQCLQVMLFNLVLRRKIVSKQTFYHRAPTLLTKSYNIHGIVDIYLF